MADEGNFKEVFNWWYFLGILLAFVAFPLLHILGGVYVYVIGNMS